MQIDQKQTILNQKNPQKSNQKHIMRLPAQLTTTLLAATALLLPISAKPIPGSTVVTIILAQTYVTTATAYDVLGTTGTWPAWTVITNGVVSVVPETTFIVTAWTVAVTPTTDFVPAQTFTFAYDGGVEVGVVEKE